MEISESKVVVSAQPLLDYKWWCDGSSGHSMCKQKFSNEDLSDESIFFTSIVPLQLNHVDEKTGHAIVVWKKLRSSSPRYCRPIKIEFVHENSDVINELVGNVSEQM